MNRRLIDLHTHSTASDGTDAPGRLIENAKKIGLAAIALTDHDTTSGLGEAREAANDLGIEFIRGCEISTSTDTGNLHIVGLWLPDDCLVLDGFLTKLRNERDKRNALIIEKLRAAGISITLEEVEASAKESIGRPHIAKILAQKGVVADINEAFDVWLAHNGKAYVPKKAPRPEQAIRMLAELGASPILAHPLLRPKPEGWIENKIREMKNYGLFGLEAWHSSHTAPQTQEIINMAQKYDLALSGGSDYHGENKPLIKIGLGNNNLAITEDVLINMKMRRRKEGLPC